MTTFLNPSFAPPARSSSSPPAAATATTPVAAVAAAAPTPPRLPSVPRAARRHPRPSALPAARRFHRRHRIAHHPRWCPLRATTITIQPITALAPGAGLRHSLSSRSRWHPVRRAGDPHLHLYRRADERLGARGLLDRLSGDQRRLALRRRPRSSTPPRVPSPRRPPISATGPTCWACNSGRPRRKSTPAGASTSR